MGRYGKHVFQESGIMDTFKNKTVLITGAYGMLPSYMVYMLIYLNEAQKDYDIQIVAVVRNKNKLISRFGDYANRPYFHVVLDDICKPISYNEKIDYIIHGASPASSQYYDTNPVGVLMPNILGTYHTLELARIKQVQSYLFFSSGEIYGQLEKS